MKFEVLKFIVFYRAKTAVRRSSDGRPPTIRRPPDEKKSAKNKVCLKEGIEQSILDAVVCPIGLNIGAESPEEIAVAVVAQIMASFKGADANAPTWRV